MKTSEQNSPPPHSPELFHDAALAAFPGNMVHKAKADADQLFLQIERLTEIGRALSRERNLNALLEMILDEARRFTHADAGTLYIKEGDTLRFKILQNETMKARIGGKPEDEIPFPPVKLRKSNVSAYVAMTGVSVNIPDVYCSNLFDFTGPKVFDKSTGYRSKSMLVVPMRNHENDVIGVLQLLNAQNPATGEIISFSAFHESLTESLASQAAVAITNVALINDMAQLFESFVEVMATAIDEKSPVMGGHIRRVAELTLEMAEVVNDQKTGAFKDIHFGSERLHELKIAALMHDIGKVTTPVNIVEKANKLETIFDRKHFVGLRFDYLVQQAKTKGLQRQLQLMEQDASQEELRQVEEDTEREAAKLLDMKNFVLMCNHPGEFLQDEKVERLQTISKLTYMDENGVERHYLTEDELENLSIRKGSITEKERDIMKHHAVVTLNMLNKIPFTKALRNIPKFAGAHHECVDGTGYPLGLKGDEIPFEGLLLAVTDVAEALTAADRPYKKAMPLSMVYQILRKMVESGKLDNNLVELFINQKVYERYKNKQETPISPEEAPQTNPKDARKVSATAR